MASTSSRAPRPPAPGQGVSDFDEAMQYFYLDPSRACFDLLSQGAERLADDEEFEANGADLWLAVMLARIHVARGWPLGNGRISDIARTLVDPDSRLARYVDDRAAADPDKLNMWWASFFATGEARYLDNVFAFAGLAPKGDVGTRIVEAAATWSFKATCRQHPAVVEYLRRKRHDPAVPPDQAEFVQECLAYAEAGGES
jgi:hypothetical protein